MIRLRHLRDKSTVYINKHGEKLFFIGTSNGVENHKCDKCGITLYKDIVYEFAINRSGVAYIDYCSCCLQSLNVLSENKEK